MASETVLQGPAEPVVRVAGVLLAGGLARRMGGGDKCRQVIAGRSLLERAISRARPQVNRLILNANGDPGRFADTGLPIAVDVVAGHAGPLAGVVTGLEWARRFAPDCAWVASFATDTPFFPRDLVGRLLAAVADEGADLACASSAKRTHPVFGLWPVWLADPLRAALETGERKIDRFTASYRLAVVPFADPLVDPFFNVNTPEDVETATRLAPADADAGGGQAAGTIGLGDIDRGARADGSQRG